MTQPRIPEMEGVTKMSPLDINSVLFNKRHTVLTPEVWAGMSTDKG